MWFSILFYIFSFPVYFHRIGFIVARFYQRAPLEGKRDKKKKCNREESMAIVKTSAANNKG